MSLTVKAPRQPVMLLLCLVLYASHAPPASAATVEWTGDSTALGQIPMTPTATSQTTVLAPPADSPSGNTVRVGNSAPLSAYVLGGYDIRNTGEGDAASSGNSVTLGDSANVTGNIYGGYAYGRSSQAGASENTVSINGGSLSGTVYGGYAYGGGGESSASENTVTINGGTTGAVYGGWAYGSRGPSSASWNAVTINNGATGAVYGGYIYSTTADVNALGNNLRIDDSTVSGTVYGGSARVNSQGGTARAEGNTVFIANSAITSAVYGGYSSSQSQAIALNNSVLIADSSVTGIVYGAFAQGNYTGGEARGNSVTISGDSILGSHVYGGLASAVYVPAIAAENSVFVNGGTIAGNVYGGYVAKGISSPPSDAVDITATANRVFVSGGTIEGSVSGGLAWRLINDSEPTGTGFATDNSVHISGGTILGNVYGGYSYTGYEYQGTVWRSTAIATNNSVTITGSPSFGTATWLYGGAGVGDDTSDFYTGNTLNVLDYYESTPVAGIANFQNYNFLVPSSLPSGSAYLQTGSLDLGDSPQLIRAGVTAGQALPDGYSVDLIRSDSEVQGGNITETRLVRQGVIMEYDGVVTTTDHALNLTLTNPRLAEGTDSISKGWTGSLALTAQGAEFVAFSGIAAANAALSGIDGYATFATVKAGDYRYNTGSHVDVKGVSMLAGVAGKVKVPGGTLVIGPAFEASYADFDGKSSGSGTGSIKHGGYGRSFGGALLGRYQHDSGAYLDASLRAGISHVDYNSGLRDDDGHSASYEARVPYYGLHVGPGWQWSLTEKATLDISAAYLWTHMEGSKETLSSGDKVRFESADSHRLRAGARVGYEVTENLAPYIGAAYEYEMDGKARAGAYGYDFKTPSLKGGSGIGEVGISWNAAPLSLDLGLQGYTGKREGFGGSLMIRFEF